MVFLHDLIIKRCWSLALASGKVINRYKSETEKLSLNYSMNVTQYCVGVGVGCLVIHSTIKMNKVSKHL